jgi:hypothetical protein
MRGGNFGGNSPSSNSKTPVFMRFFTSCSIALVPFKVVQRIHFPGRNLCRHTSFVFIYLKFQRQTLIISTR